MGWYMVQSGLVDVPAVSHYRLAAHLGLAFVILGALLLLAFSLSPIKKDPQPRLFWHGLATFAVLAITIVWGAFTAGLDAGLLYNDTFPKMGGQWIPPDFWARETVLANILENHSAVQFTHRWLGMFTVFMIASLWAHGLYAGYRSRLLHAVFAMALLQMGLGIATLLSNVHLHVATAHQGGAAILFSLLLLLLYRISPNPESALASSR
jgi:cytochrome c oxidase assembly protein subunit 15